MAISLNPIKPFILPKKNYVQVAIIEIILIFCVLSMGDIARIFGLQPTHPIVAGALLIPEAIYLYILYQLATFLTENKLIHRIILILFIIVAILSIIGLSPLLANAAIKTDILIVVHICLCAVECYLIALGLQDIYLDKLSLKDRLWGSVAMYLLIAIGWASFYEIFLLFDHGILGVVLIPGYQTYAEALYFSLCSLSGTGSIYTAPDHLIRNLALIEAVWGVLFLVMLIGRVFAVSDDK